MFQKLTSGLIELKQNIFAGARLAFFRRSAFPRFSIGFDQAIILISFNFLFLLIIDYIKYVPDPEFNSYAISGYCLQLIGLLISAYVLAKTVNNNLIAMYFVIQVSSLSPFLYLAWIILISQFGESFIKEIEFGITIWGMAVVVFTLLHHLNHNKIKMILPILAYSLLVIMPGIWIPTGEFWYVRYQESEDTQKYKNINQENLFYDQFDHLQRIDQELLLNRPSIIDLYFLGYGSYAREDVFMKEVHYIQNLMDQKYNTQGRSVALINNINTMETTPLATKSNLTKVLASIGQAMDVEEDILFLYLTSHGSKKHKLAVSFWPLQLNSVSPEDIRFALDSAKIKWRVILVSACYSGGFIEPLKNDHSLILTASAYDRTSFGCGTESEFTYFGQAVFKEQLIKNHSFINAFEQAIQSIEKREKKENITGSLPQLFVGANIKMKLRHLENELDTYYQRKPTRH